MGAPTAQELIDGILAGNLMLLSRAISMVESTRPDHQAIAEQVIEACLPHTGKAARLGITGVPGVGKSTFIEAFGLELIDKGKKIAVLAIDPSSTKTKGSILGDKTRMEDLSRNNMAYIRPSASGGALGGVALRTREAMLLCEAAGFDVVIIETVGVGQSETQVAQMVDFFLLLMLPGAGDELQGMKRGIMEMADALVINKADGNNVDAAKRAAKEYQNALHLFPAGEGGWVPEVTTCSALEKNNIGQVWDIIEKHRKLMMEQGLFEAKRQQQDLFWFRNGWQSFLREAILNRSDLADQVSGYEEAIKNKMLSPYKAARQLVLKLVGG